MHRSCLVTLCFLASAAELHGAIIDTFSTPLFDQSASSSVSNSFNTSTVTQNGLSTTEVVGGQRIFRAITLHTPHPNDPTARVTATMNGAAADPDFDNTFIAPSHGNGTYSAETVLIWGDTVTSPLNLDIGTDTVFLLTLEDINLSPISVLNAELFLTLDTGTGSQTISQALLIGGLLQPEYQFAGFTGIDLHDIDRITLTLRTLTNKNSSSFTVTYGAFASMTVPEPGSLTLLGLAGAGIGLAVRRGRNRVGDPSAAKS